MKTRPKNEDTNKILNLKLEMLDLKVKLYQSVEQNIKLIKYIHELQFPKKNRKTRK